MAEMHRQIFHASILSLGLLACAGHAPGASEPNSAEIEQAQDQSSSKGSAKEDSPIAAPVAVESAAQLPTAELACSELQSHALELQKWVSSQGGSLSFSYRRGDKTIAEIDASQPLNPASVTKLYTAALALESLGADYQFKTAIFGKIQGDSIDELVIKGGGDPSLENADLWRLARALVHRGVKKIHRLRVDQQLWGAPSLLPPAFEQQPNEKAPFRAAIAPLSVSRNSFSVNIRFTAPKEKPLVWLNPEGIADIENRASSIATGKGVLHFSSKEADQKMLVKIWGEVGPDHSFRSFSQRVADPSLSGLRIFASILADQGITVSKDLAQGSAKGLPQLSYIESSPLSKLLYAMGKESDNFTAEMISAQLGVSASEKTPSSAEELFKNSAMALKQFCIKNYPEASAEDCRFSNGSGLFDANRVSAHSTVALLEWVLSQPKLREEFLAQLSVAGTDGTLSARHIQAAADSSSIAPAKQTSTTSIIRAKSGTLAQVVAMAGYVEHPGSTRPDIFSITTNGLKIPAADIRKRFDQLLSHCVN